jgi:hypothetical protein
VRETVRKTESWLIRQGLPQLIAGYSFTGHILPRMVPFLALVAVTGLLWPLRDEASPVGRFTAVATVLIGGVAAGVLLNRFRRLPTFPRWVAITVVVAYGIMPLLIPLLDLVIWHQTSAPDLRAGEIASSSAGYLGATLVFAIIFAVLFELSRLATTYGALPMLERAVRHAVRDLRNTVRLQSRALPMLLFVTLFFFFTGELWQAMDRLSWWRLSGVLALFAAVTVFAAAGRLREEIGRVEQDLSQPRLVAACQDTPLAELDLDHLPLSSAPPPLNSRQIGNLLVMLASRQLIQAMVVGLWLFAFFLIVGLLVVSPETAEQWIGGPPHYSPVFPSVPSALFRNAALLAGFGSMYFAVTSMIDTENRRQFFAPILEEVESTLAVRAVYLAAVSSSSSQAPSKQNSA